MEEKWLYPTVYKFNCARVLNSLRNYLLSKGGKDIYPKPLKPTLYHLEERETERRADTMVYSYLYMRVNDMDIYVQLDSNMFFPDRFYIETKNSKNTMKTKELPKKAWQTDALLDAEISDNEIVEIAHKMLKAMQGR